MATGRECGSCTLCCKVMGVSALQKPQGSWCPHCVPGQGCGIYDERPQECRNFLCGWMQDSNLGEDWKPQRAKFVLSAEPGRFVAHVDPGAPDAWRKAPYFAALNRMMQVKLQQGALFYICIAGRYTLLLPDGEYPIGALASEDEVAVATLARPGGGLAYQVSVRKPSGVILAQPVGPSASSGEKRIL